MQASWRKNGAKLNFQANYTFSKVMGVLDGDSSNGGSNGWAQVPFRLRENYAPLGYDHTHIFNVWYIYNLPSPIHGNRALATLINDWKLSGWNTFQSGAPLQPNSGGNFNANYQGNFGSARSGTPAGVHRAERNLRQPDQRGKLVRSFRQRAGTSAHDLQPEVKPAFGSVH